MLTLPPEFMQFLAFLATPVFGAWFVSEFLENAPFFQKLDSAGKSRLVMFVYVLLGLLSYGLTQWTTPEVAAQLQPIYSVIVGALVAFASGQQYHDVKHEASDSTTP